MDQEQLPIVLITGGTGFIGAHVIRAFAATNRFRIRTSSRQINDEKRKKLESLGASEVVEAELTSKNGWDEAVADCTYVIHVASPFLLVAKDPEKDLLEPALSGVRFVLEACAESKTLQRVVLTSSVAAVVDDCIRFENGKVFDEDDWNTTSSLENGGAYEFSKVSAERFAWDFVEKHKDTINWTLVAINPSFVIGPPLLLATSPKNVNSSNQITVKVLNGDYPAYPKLNMNCVHVADVADAHLLACSPEASGRYVISGGLVSMSDQGRLLIEQFPALEGVIAPPTRLLPNFITLVASLFDSEVSFKAVYDRIGEQPPQIDASKSKLLGVKYRSPSEMVVDSARALASFPGVLTNPKAVAAIKGPASE